MTTLEIIIWLLISLILMKFNEKPIYEYFQNLQIEWNKFIGIDEDINQYIDIEENIENVVNYTK